MPNRLLEHLTEAQRATIPRYRRTGKSTAMALAALAKAIDNPGMPVTVVDHYFGSVRGGNQKANQHLAGMIEHHARLLGLKFVSVRRTEQGVTVQSDHIT